MLKAIEAMGIGLEGSLPYIAFSTLDARKISSTNTLEWLNEEIRQRSRLVGIFPNPNSNLCLVATFLMVYTEGWSVSRAYFSEESNHALLPQYNAN